MLEKVTERIYYLMNENKTERPALGIVKGEKYCLVVDAGNSPKHAEILIREIEKMNFPPAKYVVATHHHWDHIFGLGRWDAITIASEKTCELSNIYRGINLDDNSLEIAKQNNIFNDFDIKCIKEEIEDRDNFQLVNFDLSFKGELKLNLGGITCFIKEISNPHREDGTIIYVPEEKTLFVGDAAYGCTKDGNSYYEKGKLISMMQEIDTHEAEYILCSHESICTKEEIISYFNQLKMGMDTTKGCNTTEEAIVKFKSVYNHEPSENDLFFLKSIYE